MTADQFTKKLPILTNNPLPIKPPFVFNGMSVRVFPLRASLDALQQLCNGYLNFVPPEAGSFRAMMPYVFLMVLDYGQVSEAVTRIGWFAQLEVFFSIPVEWYKLVDGNWVFHDWAVITPYVFVNDSFSVPLGRTVYGFPKVLAQVTSSPSHWIENPLAPVTLARVETALFPEVYTGTGLETKVFLEIQRDAPMSNFQVPPDPRSPMMPWMVASHLASAMGGFGRDAMWLAQAMRIFPVNPGAVVGAIPEMLARMVPALAPGGKGFVTNSLNLKQFRQASDPTKICYQSLTNGCMILTGFNGGGLLGEERTFLGDLSGGHTVKLYQNSSLPIARTLGLEVHRDVRNGADITAMELKPVAPFWMSMDLIYDQGTNVAWQTRDGIWKDPSGEPFHPGKQAVSDADSPQFNSTVSSAIEAITGPFEYAGATIRVLPLLAKRKTLQDFLDTSINQSLADPVVREDGKGREQVRLSVWARPPAQVNQGNPIGGDFAYVYLTASSYAGITSKTNNVGDWVTYELEFLIPVKFERKDAAGRWQTVGAGVVPAYTLEDNCIAAISRFEVQGFDARTATFICPQNVWMDEGAPSVDSMQTLLRVDAEVWTAYGTGQKALVQPLVEIVRNDPTAGLGAAGSRDTPYMRAEDLRLELGTKKGIKAKYPEDCKIARALALELLGDQTPLSVYTLKQFRDVADPDKACYQELVRVSRVLREVFDVREIEETLVVQIFDYPSLNIVETLGIVATTVDNSGAGIGYNAQAIRPFYVRATLDEPLAERLLSRSGGMEWGLSTQAFDSLLSDEGPRIVADAQAERLQDQMDPSVVSAVVYQSHGGAAQTFSSKAFTKEQARKALHRVDAQMVIESILSREWGNNDPNARWRQGREELLKAISALPESGDIKSFAESVLYRKLNNVLADRPGAVASFLPTDDLTIDGVSQSLKDHPPDLKTASGRWQKELEEIFESQFRFTEMRMQMEESLDLLAAYGIMGPRGVESAFQMLGKPVPTDQEVMDVGTQLMQSLQAIRNLTVEGEPSERSNLDTYVLADKVRLGELLDRIMTELTPGVSFEVILETAGSQIVDQFRQVIDLARRFCEAQQDALLNKLSRAYQKPDFCIRRDAVGVDNERLLPAALSWDADWYYGKVIEGKELC